MFDKLFAGTDIDIPGDRIGHGDALEIVDGGIGLSLAAAVGHNTLYAAEMPVGRESKYVAGVDIGFVHTGQTSLRRPLIETPRRHAVGGVSTVKISGVGVDIETVGVLHPLHVAGDGTGQMARQPAAASCAHHLGGVDGVGVEMRLAGDGGVSGSHGHELAVGSGGVVDRGGSQHHAALCVGLAVESRAAVENHRAGIDFVIIARRVDAEILPRAAHHSVEIDGAGIDSARHLHLRGIDDAHGALVVMILLKGVAARIRHKKMAVVERDTFRLVAHLHSIGHAVGIKVDFRHKTADIAARGAVDHNVVGIGGDIEMPSVRHHIAVVGHILGGGDRFPLDVGELDDIAPVHGNCQPVVVNLDDVVGGIAELPAVGVAEILVAHNAAVFEIREAAVVGLPLPLVEKQYLLLSDSRQQRGRT